METLAFLIGLVFGLIVGLLIGKNMKNKVPVKNTGGKGGGDVIVPQQ